VPDLEIGDTGVMTIGGFAPNLPFTVRSLSPETIHVEFDLGSHRETYRLWLDANLKKAA
jgi:hypothetical protein